MNVNVKKVIGKTTHGMLLGALMLGGVFVAYSPTASAHSYHDINGYSTTADNCSWTTDAVGNRYLVVDYETTSPYPFRLTYDDGYKYNGHWYTFAHRYYVNTDTGYHSYYYYRYEPRFGGGMYSDYNNYRIYNQSYE